MSNLKPGSATTRQHDIDWLRILAVLLLIPFHSARVFDFWEPFYVKNAQTSTALSILIALIDPWHMPLLFLLAGAATWYALGVRGGVGYVKERFKRLFIPIVFGALVVVPPQPYLAALHHSTFMGSFLQYLTSYFTWHDANTDYTGEVFTTAHLWFIQLLFIFSLLSLPLFQLVKRRTAIVDWLAALCEKRGAIFLLALPLWFVKALAELSSEPRWAHIVFFIYGFLLMSDPRIRIAVERDRRIALTLGLVTMFAYSLTWVILGVTEFPRFSIGDILFYTVRTLNSWFWVVAILGYGRRYLNFTNQWQKYANEATYPFYVLHQTVIIAIGYFVVAWDVNLWIKFFSIAIGALVVIIVLYDVGIKRWNVMRFLFGMKPIVQATLKGHFAVSHRHS